MSMMQRSKNFWNELLWKPKNPLSLEQLKYHYLVLERNPTVTESNKKLLVETFRSIAEILIWGDQNDSSVFDFFLEKNMQSYFLRILTRQPGRYVVLQLLQTMSILFENIRNETSIYYLLSNNHVNSIIVLKLDFSDEEVLAYYISFLKTLSFKLNKHTIHFFFNEHLRDFPLYTEAIKFFNHPESMVRIAVRTLTLNVYKVNDSNSLEFIRNKTAAPYFSNLVWFIGNHVLQLEECLEQRADHLNRNNLESAVAEHLDYLHYLNDILSLSVTSLNEILCDHLLNRLFIPLYVYSLFEIPFAARKDEDTPRVSSGVALFLLSQVFLILSDTTLTTQLSYLILTGDHTLSFPPSLSNGPNKSPPRHRRSSSKGSMRGFIPPQEPLSFSLNQPLKGQHASPKPVRRGGRNGRLDVGELVANGSKEGSSTESMKELEAIPEYDGFVVIESPSEQHRLISPVDKSNGDIGNEEEVGDQDEEEEVVEDSVIGVTPIHAIPIKSSVFVDSILTAVIPGPNDDSKSLFAITLFYALVHNKGINPLLLEAFALKKCEDWNEPFYLRNELIGRLLSVIEASAVGSVRLVTLHLCISLLTTLLEMLSDHSKLSDHQLKKLERAIEGSCIQLSKFYRTLGEDDMFLEMFEDEFAHEKRFLLKADYLLMDATMLLPPAGTPLTGIDFTRRLPCGQTEKARRAMRVFFAIRDFSQTLNEEQETRLPLTPYTTSVVTEDIVDTTNCDLVLCSVVTGEKCDERFMMVTDSEFILVNPDKSKLGCGVVKFIAFLQDVDISPDPADNCSLFIVAHHRSRSQVKRRPALSAKITFEDHIRCIATKQNLQKRKEQLRHTKMTIIAELLGIPPPASPIRKRGSPITSPSLPSNLTISSSENPIGTQQSLSPSSTQSVHMMAIDTFRTSPVPDKVEQEIYELNPINTQTGPPFLRTPSPQVLYVHNSEKVLLSLNGETFDSPVMILPPLEQEEFKDRDSDEEIERKEVKEEEVEEKKEDVEEKKELEEVEEKEEEVEEKKELEEVDKKVEEVEEEDEEVLLGVFKRNQTESVESKKEFEKDGTSLTSDSDNDQQQPMEYIPSILTDENTQTAETIVNNSTTLN